MKRKLNELLKILCVENNINLKLSIQKKLDLLYLIDFYLVNEDLKMFDDCSISENKRGEHVFKVKYNNLVYSIIGEKSFLYLIENVNRKKPNSNLNTRTKKIEREIKSIVNFLKFDEKTSFNKLMNKSLKEYNKIQKKNQELYLKDNLESTYVDPQTTRYAIMRDFENVIKSLLN